MWMSWGPHSLTAHHTSRPPQYHVRWGRHDPCWDVCSCCSCSPSQSHMTHSLQPVTSIQGPVHGSAPPADSHPTYTQQPSTLNPPAMRASSAARPSANTQMRSGRPALTGRGVAPRTIWSPRRALTRSRTWASTVSTNLARAVSCVRGGGGWGLQERGVR
jgi:hypothetical protein